MIHVQGLTKYYKDFCAVDAIDFDVNRGEILGILGPNGAGKTTTLRMLTGFLRPTSGTIRIKDYTIEKNSLEIKELLGYLPESAPLYHDMIVYDYLQYVAKIRKVGGKVKRLSRIGLLNELCGLHEVMHKPISEISRGYRQRVGLAHAMMKDPELLVLDEPTSGLDPNQIVEIREIIKQIGKEKTIILSTHILSEAEVTCDRVLIIDHGKIVADGSAATLQETVRGQLLINITLENADFGAVQKALDQIEGVEETVRLHQEEDGGNLQVRLTCRTSADPRGEIYRKIKQNEWILLELRPEARTLEYIFRELTREN